MNSVLENLKRININSPILTNVDMKKYTTFKTGGTAEIFIKAHSIEDIIEIQNFAKDSGTPLFILGGGANILVSDRGIKGITLYLGELNHIEIKGNVLTAQSGVIVNTLCETAFKASLSGFEFIYGMPGTLGGALYMNARCYGEEISDSFIWGEYLNESGKIIRIEKDIDDWAYKQSPFQIDNIVILKAAFKLKNGSPEKIKDVMDSNFKDRRDKGHFSFPCAGSVFKNNRNYGAPTGKIIDDAGLKGFKYGGAQIAEYHGNIIINRGNATSSDIDWLIKHCIKTVYDKFGYKLEPEVIKVGNWR